MTKKIKIAVITQNDNFVIPINFKLLCDAEWIEISELILIDAQGSLENKKSLFIYGFGLLQTLKMGLVTITYKCKAFLASKFKFIDKKEWLNLKGLCSYHNIQLNTERDVNSDKLLCRLREYDLDVIVSFSAPSVFKNNLLNIPRFGCINLHCSALPAYAGVMPSFWVLYNEEKEAGVSVHMMDSKIDNGAVLAQEVVNIVNINNMFDIIKATKLRGGHMMLNILEVIHKKNTLPTPIDTSHNKESYFSWPKVQDFKNLVKKGKRLI